MADSVKQQRLAVYFTPRRDSSLTAAAETWLGYSLWRGDAVGQSAHAYGPSETAMKQFTDSPRRYGFHATIKAPMRLAPGVDEALFSAAVEQCAQALPSVVIRRPVLRWIGRFLALVPHKQGDDLSDMASKVVRQLDRFRAPLTQADIDRRNPENLSRNQLRLLQRWGYPFVEDEFRFHMTLTGPIDEG